MKKVLAFALMFLVFTAPILAQAASPSPQKFQNASSPHEMSQGAQISADKSVDKPAEQQPSSERGKGLTNAIEHVPSFVAEKLSYQAKLFSDGVKGIGQGLSEWIHSFFNP